MSNSPPLVYIVDDDAGVRRSLEFLVQSGGYASRSFDSAESFLAAGPLASREWGCVLLDVRMQGMSGEDLMRAIHREECPLPVVFLTGHGDVRTAVQMMKLGAADFLEKPIDDKGLLERIAAALRQRADGGKSAGVAAGAGIPAKIAERLTPRELDVLGRLCAGKPSKRIAYELAVSVKTVEHYRSRLFQKFEAANAADLVRKVMSTTT